MGMILIIIGLILIASAVILLLFYRKKPLKYTAPEIRGTAVSHYTQTVRDTSQVSAMKTAEEETVPLTQDGMDDETIADYGSETVPLIGGFRTHDETETVPLDETGTVPLIPSADDETQAL